MGTVKDCVISSYEQNECIGSEFVAGEDVASFIRTREKEGLEIRADLVNPDQATGKQALAALVFDSDAYDLL